MTLAWALLAATVLVWPPRRPGTSQQERDGSLPLALDLAAAALRAGQPLPAALETVAPAIPSARRADIVRVARMLALGAHPDDAWRPVAEAPGLAGVAVAARRSAHSGLRLADGFERAAAELRASARNAAQVRAQRAGIWGMAPLGLCFLPAFVCLGIVPVVVGLVGQALSR